MKRILLVFALMGTFLCQAQEEGLNQEDQTEETLVTGKPYNQWSLDLGVGGNKALKDFAPGYWMPTVDFPQASLGIRYMFNTRFGMRLDFGYQKMSDEEGKSREFNTNFYRGTLEGVMNLGNVLNFNSWTNSLNVLLHGGAGISMMNFDAVGATDDNDNMINYVLGITPQLKLSNRISLNGDVSMVGNLLQNATYDGTIHQPTSGAHGLDGVIWNASVGLSISLGSKEHSADFYPHNEETEDALDAFEERLSKIETDMIDSDQDGVPDYLDREPNTTSGVAVNTKGIAIDLNENGIPDELESSLDARYMGKEDSRDLKVIEELLQEGYVNVYFGFNSDKPATYSLWAINQLVTYFRENSSAEAELQGFADTRGDRTYNEDLSERRARSVYDILVAAGVDPGRLSYTGMGEDDSVEDNSSEARQLVRKVTIRLKE